MNTDSRPNKAAQLRPADALPFLFGGALFGVILAGQVWYGLRANAGVFCYALDDAYIHMAIARNVALHGVWGLNPDAFASASSSPGWTLLLAAAVKAFGDWLYLSLALNAVFALVLLAYADARLRRWMPAGPLWPRYGLQAALVLLVPLPSMALVGMEHSAQAFGAVWLAVMAAEALSVPPASKLFSRTLTGLLAATFFLCSIRYETVFLVLPILLALLVRRRIAVAGMFALASGLPPFLFGLFARSHGPFWLPYSVMAKASDSGHLRVFALTAFNQWTRVGILAVGCPLFLCTALWLVRAAQHPRWERAQVVLGLAFVVCVEHLTLAPTGWLMRYEGYLFALTFFAVAAGVQQEWPRWRGLFRSAQGRLSSAAVAVLVAGVLYPAMGDRAWKGIVYPAQAMHDRLLEHFQPAFFIAKNYDHATVVANDIGAISYFSHARVLDPVGLGSVEPHLAMRQKHAFTADDLAAWAQKDGAQIAVLETGWSLVGALVPPQWIKVQTWNFPRNVVYSNLKVTFFAMDAADAAELKKKLDATVLPAGMSRTD